jgi:S-adenosyl-l-methionine hydroxide adenosyltransferase
MRARRTRASDWWPAGPPAAGSQFRSRDFFPAAVARLVREGGDALGEPVPDDRVPPVPERVIAYVDGYGNVKTTYAEAPAATGTRVLVRIGGIAATGVVSDGTFSVDEGELAFAPGSSGWRGQALYELFLRGASAAARFSHPTVGSPVEVTPLPR